MQTFLRLIFLFLLTPQMGITQDSHLQPARDALVEIDRIIADASKSGPAAMTGALKRIEKVIDSVDRQPLYQSQKGVELLVDLTAKKTQTLRHQRKIAEARRFLQDTEAGLANANGSSDALAISHSQLLLLIQDLSFDDQNWKELDRNIGRLRDNFDKMGNSIEAVKHQGAIGVQMIRYLGVANRPNEIEGIATEVIGRIRKADGLSDVDRMILVGRIVDQVLDFRSQDASWKSGNVWLEQASQAWRVLRDQKEQTTCMLAGELIAHRAALVPNSAESQSCWREYEDWLRRDSFAAIRDAYIGREYIEANVRYLNRIEPSQFAVHLIRTYQFLDELKEKLEAMSKSKSTPALVGPELADLMRSQLDKRISQRKTAMKRPKLQQIAPTIDFHFIDTSMPGSLSQYHGKVVVLEFWNPHCGPCLSSFEWLSEFHRKYRDRGLTVLGCTYAADEYLSEQGQELTREQSLKKFREFLSKHKVDYPMVLASDVQVLHNYGVQAEPTLVILDRQGKICSFAVGIGEFQSDTCQKIIMKALER